MIKKLEISTVPDAHIIESIRNTKISASEAIAEIVDNSLDAGASVVEIVTEGSLKVTDNGRGCSDIASMLRLGHHSEHATTKMGRYGVGLKNASLGLCDELVISTTSKAGKIEAIADWEKLGRMGNWIPVEATHDSSCNSKTGTIVELRRLRRRIVTANIESQFSFLFSPAMAAGAKITINGARIKPWMPRHGENKIEFSGQHSSGLGYKAEASIVDRNDKGPFIISYGHRILCATSEPCGDFSPNSKFICYVTIFDENKHDGSAWPLLKHKDGIQDSDVADWLYESLHKNCESMLSQLHNEGESVELDLIASELENAIGDILGIAKRPNRPGIKTKRKKAKPTPRQIQHADVVDPGDGDVEGVGEKQSRGFSIRFDTMPETIIGAVDVNKKRMSIRLNIAHPYIKMMTKANNRDCLTACAVFLLCENQSNGGEKNQCLMRFAAESQSDQFNEAAAKIFDRLAAIGTPIHAMAE